MRQDESLRNHVIEKLGYWTGDDPSELTIRVEGAVVTIMGEVGSYARKVSILRVASRVRGIRSVFEAIRVNPSLADWRTDGELTASAIMELAWNISVPGHEIRVRARAGVLTLSGTVKSSYQAYVAGQALETLPGLVDIVNRIEIELPALKLMFRRLFAHH